MPRPTGHSTRAPDFGSLPPSAAFRPPLGTWALQPASPGRLFPRGTPAVTGNLLAVDPLPPARHPAISSPLRPPMLPSLASPCSDCPSPPASRSSRRPCKVEDAEVGKEGGPAPPAAGAQARVGPSGSPQGSPHPPPTAPFATGAGAGPDAPPAGRSAASGGRGSQRGAGGGAGPAPATPGPAASSGARSSASGGDSAGASAGAAQAELKKGLWSPEEDAALTSAVLRFRSAGNWTAIAARSGLQRSGKSCRLRWVKHLAPSVRAGPLSEEEQRLVIALQARHGNKWALISQYLPGRSDNCVKNFWNSHRKRLRRREAAAKSTALMLQAHRERAGADRTGGIVPYHGGFGDPVPGSSLTMQQSGSGEESDEDRDDSCHPSRSHEDSQMVSPGPSQLLLPAHPADHLQASFRGGSSPYRSGSEGGFDSRSRLSATMSGTSRVGAAASLLRMPVLVGEQREPSSSAAMEEEEFARPPPESGALGLAAPDSAALLSSNLPDAGAAMGAACASCDYFSLRGGEGCGPATCPAGELPGGGRWPPEGAAAQEGRREESGERKGCEEEGQFSGPHLGPAAPSPLSLPPPQHCFGEHQAPHGWPAARLSAPTRLASCALPPCHPSSPPPPSPLPLPSPLSLPRPPANWRPLPPSSPYALLDSPFSSTDLLCGSEEAQHLLSDWSALDSEAPTPSNYAPRQHVDFPAGSALAEAGMLWESAPQRSDVSNDDLHLVTSQAPNSVVPWPKHAACLPAPPGSPPCHHSPLLPSPHATASVFTTAFAAPKCSPSTTNTAPISSKTALLSSPCDRDRCPGLVCAHPHGSSSSRQAPHATATASHVTESAAADIPAPTAAAAASGAAAAAAPTAAASGFAAVPDPRSLCVALPCASDPLEEDERTFGPPTCESGAPRGTSGRRSSARCSHDWGRSSSSRIHTEAAAEGGSSAQPLATAPESPSRDPMQVQETPQLVAVASPNASGTTQTASAASHRGCLLAQQGAPRNASSGWPEREGGEVVRAAGEGGGRKGAFAPGEEDEQMLEGAGGEGGDCGARSTGSAPCGVLCPPHLPSHSLPCTCELNTDGTTITRATICASEPPPGITSSPSTHFSPPPLPGPTGEHSYPPLLNLPPRPPLFHHHRTSASPDKPPLSSYVSEAPLSVPPVRAWPTSRFAPPSPRFPPACIAASSPHASSRHPPYQSQPFPPPAYLHPSSFPPQGLGPPPPSPFPPHPTQQHLSSSLPPSPFPPPPPAPPLAASRRQQQLLEARRMWAAILSSPRGMCAALKDSMPLALRCATLSCSSVFSPQGLGAADSREAYAQPRAAARDPVLSTRGTAVAAAVAGEPGGPEAMCVRSNSNPGGDQGLPGQASAAAYPGGSCDKSATRCAAATPDSGGEAAALATRASADDCSAGGRGSGGANGKAPAAETAAWQRQKEAQWLRELLLGDEEMGGEGGGEEGGREEGGGGTHSMARGVSGMMDSAMAECAQASVETGPCLNAWSRESAAQHQWGRSRHISMPTPTVESPRIALPATSSHSGHQQDFKGALSPGVRFHDSVEMTWQAFSWSPCSEVVAEKCVWGLRGNTPVHSQSAPAIPLHIASGEKEEKAKCEDVLVPSAGLATLLQSPTERGPIWDVKSGSYALRKVS